MWSGSVSKNIYRNGHTGKVCAVFNVAIIGDCYHIILLFVTKVDLKCISPTCGGHYYPDHLELLGEI